MAIPGSLCKIHRHGFLLEYFSNVVKLVNISEGSIVIYMNTIHFICLISSMSTICEYEPQSGHAGTETCWYCQAVVRGIRTVDGGRKVLLVAHPRQQYTSVYILGRGHILG